MKRSQQRYWQATQSSLVSRGSVALVLGLACAGGTWAQTSPYYIGASQGFTHESNLFRQATGEVDDMLSSTTLFAGVDQPFGRQRFYANGSVSANRYKETSRLNNTGYGLNVGADLSTVERLSGTVRFAANQGLADYGAPGAASTSVKSLERSRLLAATARYGLTAKVALEGGAQHRAVDYSDPASASRESKQNVVNGGFRYGVSGFLTFGAGLRFTKGDYPSAIGGADETNRRDLDLTTTWTPTGLSTVNARVSFGKETHLQPAQPDFSGVTGSLSWLYRPSAKLSFSTSLSRDTGTESRFLDYTGGTASPATENYRLTNAARVGVGYDLTAKIHLNGSLRHSRGTLTDGALEGRDRTNEITLGFSYDVARNISLGCSAERESRNSNTALSSEYTANTVGCSAQITLR